MEDADADGGDDVDDDDGDGGVVEVPAPARTQSNVGLTSAESMNAGDIDFQLYVSYFRAGGSWPVVLAVLGILFGGIALFMSCSWWLARWGTLAPSDQHATMQWLGYLLLALSTVRQSGGYRGVLHCRHRLV